MERQPAEAAQQIGAHGGESGAQCELSVVLPCLNEAATVAACVRAALEACRGFGLAAEVIVVDNGSTDGSAEIAAGAGARVLVESRRGYGSALMAGIEAARGRWVLMADADESYDLGDLGRFVEALRAGADLVMGSRLRGTIEPGAMPWLHRWIGNPLLSGLLNRMFRVGVSDAHCGMRAFRKAAYERMQLQTIGMEFASEMVIKAGLGGLRIREIPITLRRDGRGRRPHLRPFRDGWRHLRFMLLFSPAYLFLLPGGLAMLLGALPLVLLRNHPRELAGLHFDIHYMAVGSALVILGYQMVTTGLFAKVYSHAARLYTNDRTVDLLLRRFTLERGLAAGVALFLWGFAIDAQILMQWLASGRGALDALRPAILGSTLMILGAQTAFSSFFLSMLLVPRRLPDPPPSGGDLSGR